MVQSSDKRPFTISRYWNFRSRLRMACNRRKLVKQCCCSYYHRKCKNVIPMGWWEWKYFWATNGNGNGNEIVLMRMGIVYFIKFPPEVWTACCFCTVTCSDSLINVEQWTVIGSDSYNGDDWWVVSLINNASVVTSCYVLISRHNILFWRF